EFLGDGSAPGPRFFSLDRRPAGRYRPPSLGGADRLMAAQDYGPARQTRAAGAVCGLWLALVAGCLGPQPARPNGWLDRLKQLGGPQGADLVVMDVAVLERPAGDHYLNGPLWSTIDEQSVDLERRAVLEDNGLRV